MYNVFFRLRLYVYFFKIMKIVRAFGILALMNYEMLTVFHWFKDMGTVRAA